MSFRFDHAGQSYGEAYLSLHNYRNNMNLAVELIYFDYANDIYDRYTTLSVNTDKVLSDHKFVAKTYSENEGLCEQLIELGLFRRTGETVDCGYAGPQPVLELTPAVADHLFDETEASR